MSLYVCRYVASVNHALPTEFEVCMIRTTEFFPLRFVALTLFDLWPKL